MRAPGAEPGACCLLLSDVGAVFNKNKMSRLKGHDLCLWTTANGTAALIGLATECSLTIDCDMVEITNPLSGRSKSYRPGRYGWQMSSSSLIAYGSASDKTAFMTKLKAGTAVGVQMAVTEGGSITSGCLTVSGTAYVQHIEMGAPVAGNATYRIDLIGTGDLTNN